MCSGCHFRENNEYPSAPRTRKCIECHAPLPEYAVVLGENTPLYLTVRTPQKAESPDSRAVEYYKSRLREDEFKLVDTPEEAKIKVDILFDIQNVKDHLVSESSGVKLAQGKSRISIQIGDKKPEIRNIVSRVVSYKENKKKYFAEILNYLMENTAEEILRVLEDNI